MAIVAFIEDKKVYPFSLGVALPPMDGQEKGKIPVFARIVTRGVASEIRSDISSLELFAVSWQHIIFSHEQYQCVYISI